MLELGKYMGKDGKVLFGILAVTVVGLTAIHYYHQIKLARLTIAEKERALGTA